MSPRFNLDYENCENYRQLTACYNLPMQSQRVFFIRAFWPGGGLENVVTSVINLMKNDMGLDPVLVLGEEPKAQVPDCQVIILGMDKITDLPLKGHPINIIRYLYRRVRYVQELKRQLKPKKGDIIVTLDPEMAGILKGLFSNVPVATWIHGSLSAFWSKSGLWPFVMTGFKRCDAIIVLSERMLEEVTRLYPEATGKTFVIHNPIDLKAIPGVYNASNPRCVYVGRIKNSEKRLDRLLKAFEHFSRQHRGWRLTLVGDGEDRAFIQSVVEQLGLDECVDISGWKSDPWRYISDTGGASFLALTSDHEGFSMALCEAAANGLPVVALDCPVGPSAIVLDGVNGVLVPFGTTEDETVQRLVDAFSAIACGRLVFDEVTVRNSINRYMPDVVKKEWEEFLRSME